MSQHKPIIIHADKCEEGWDDDLHGRLRWRTLFSAERTPTEALTAGVAEISPGDQLKAHRHTPAEVYYILAGTGEVVIDGESSPVNTGTAIYIPGNALHCLGNTGKTILRLFYVFAVNTFDEVDYLFPGEHLSSKS